MSAEDFYRLFAETGEPVYWLLSRAPDKAGDGRAPREEEGGAPPD